VLAAVTPDPAGRDEGAQQVIVKLTAPLECCGSGLVAHEGDCARLGNSVQRSGPENSVRLTVSALA
jgi:hypothetical protein